MYDHIHVSDVNPGATCGLSDWELPVLNRVALTVASCLTLWGFLRSRVFGHIPEHVFVSFAVWQSWQLFTLSLTRLPPYLLSLSLPFHPVRWTFLPTSSPAQPSPARPGPAFYDVGLQYGLHSFPFGDVTTGVFWLSAAEHIEFPCCGCCWKQHSCFWDLQLIN